MTMKRKIQNLARQERAARADRARPLDPDGLDPDLSTSPSPRSDLACAIAELIYLTRLFGRATLYEWRSHVRPDVSRPTAERQWERLKLRLIQLGIPHERVAVERVTIAETTAYGNGYSGGQATGIGIVMRIGCEQVDEYIPKTGFYVKAAVAATAARAREGLGLSGRG